MHIAEVISGNSAWVSFLVIVVVMLCLIGLVSLGVRTIFGARTDGFSGRTTQSDPEQVLKMRLANGEIDAEEYERLRGLIRDNR